MATLKTYLIEYIVYGKDGSILKSGKIKAKKKESEFAAKSKFGAHIEKKYGDQFGRLVIKSCNEENPWNNLFGKNSDTLGSDNLSDLFGGMFGGKI